MADTLIALLRNEKTDYFTCLSNAAKDISDHIESYSSSNPELSETGIQRLSSFLPEVHQFLSPQVEQMLYPAVNTRRLRGILRGKPENSNGETSENMKRFCGYCSISDSSSDNNILCATCLSSLSLNEIKEENENVAYLKNIDASFVDEALEKYTNIHLKTLSHMEAHMEILLDIVISILTCKRSLREEDKIKIKELIERLSPEHVEKICAIIGNKVKVNSKAELLEELNKEGMTTSWWIYFIVSAFQRDKIRKM